MINPMTTNDVRRLIESGGVPEPSLRAVQMVAQQVPTNGSTKYWELLFDPSEIRAAANKCVHIYGEQAYGVFASALKQVQTPVIISVPKEVPYFANL